MSLVELRLRSAARASNGLEAENLVSHPSESLFMNIANRSATTAWSLTRMDVLLCVLPVALFLSIISLV